LIAFWQQAQKNARQNQTLFSKTSGVIFTHMDIIDTQVELFV